MHLFFLFPDASQNNTPYPVSNIGYMYPPSFFLHRYPPQNNTGALIGPSVGIQAASGTIYFSAVFGVR